MLAAVFLLCGGIFAGISFCLPDHMLFIAGREANLQTQLPLSAGFSEKSLEVLNVDQKPISGNLHVNLSEGVSINPKKEGHAQVSFSLFGMVPVKTVAVEILPEIKIIPCGTAVGVSIHTQGIMVLGTGEVHTEDNTMAEPAKGIIKSGDRIVKAGGNTVERKEDLLQAVEQTQDGTVSLLIQRGSKQIEADVKPVKSSEDGKYKLGLWVRDGTQGIGTMTFYNPETNEFGALGHGVYDVDTNMLLSCKDGEITKSEISGVKKGQKGVPGEVSGSVDHGMAYGTIEKNTNEGLYGKLYEESKQYFPGEAMPIALKQEVQEGTAEIITDILGSRQRYTIQIQSIDRNNSHPDKGMIVQITDERLLQKTNGIIQGMSGSPIIQNNKVVGAITHVFVQDPSKGYGIFIENMLGVAQGDSVS